MRNRRLTAKVNGRVQLFGIIFKLAAVFISTAACIAHLVSLPVSGSYFTAQAISEPLSFTVSIGRSATGMQEVPFNGENSTPGGEMLPGERHVNEKDVEQEDPGTGSPKAGPADHREAGAPETGEPDSERGK